MTVLIKPTTVKADVQSGNGSGIGKGFHNSFYRVFRSSLNSASTRSFSDKVMEIDQCQSKPSSILLIRFRLRGGVHGLYSIPRRARSDPVGERLIEALVAGCARLHHVQRFGNLVQIIALLLQIALEHLEGAGDVDVGLHP